MNKALLAELFYPLLRKARLEDVKLDDACRKIDGKLEDFALDLGISESNLRLLDLATPSGAIHPRLLAFIDGLPRRPKQTEQRYKDYKEEIVSNIRRAIRAAASEGAKGGDVGTTNRGEQAHGPSDWVEHPVLLNLYEYLPRKTFKVLGAERGGWRAGEDLTDNGWLLYVVCARVLGEQPVDSLADLVGANHTRVKEVIDIVCPTEKIMSIKTLLCAVRRKLEIYCDSGRPHVKVDDFPSPLREQMGVYRKVAEGILLPDLVSKAADAHVKLKFRLSWVSYHTAASRIGKLLSRFPPFETLGVQDILNTTETKVVNAQGKEEVRYHNDFLSPYREELKARDDDTKRAGFDAQELGVLLVSLKSLAAYNGIFEYHNVIDRAFDLVLDIETREKNKARKKRLLDRHELDRWIEDNWARYERIMKGRQFVYDKSLRGFTEAYDNARFGLFYALFVTLKVMGYRQAQPRDCREGINIIVTKSSIVLDFPKTKNYKALYFSADLETCEATHGVLIKTLYLYRKYYYPHATANLAATNPEPKGFVDPTYEPEGQFFLYQHPRTGKYKCFDPGNYGPAILTSFFKRAAMAYLKTPKLQKQAALLIHPHFMRGVSMDTNILDHGMSADAASRYYGDRQDAIERSYIDRSAPQDASRDVALMNATNRHLKDLAEGKRRGDAEAERMKRDFEERDRQRQAELREAKEREREKDKEIAQNLAEIAGLKSLICEVQSQSTIQHQEIMKVLSISDKRALRKSNKKKLVVRFC